MKSLHLLAVGSPVKEILTGVNFANGKLWVGLLCTSGVWCLGHKNHRSHQA